MANLKISQLSDGNPAQSTDLVPIDRAGSNFALTAGSIAALGSSSVIQMPTAGTESPSPAYGPEEAPPDINPSFYIQDINGEWHAQAGVDTVSADVDGSGPTGPAGTLTFTKRVFFRDSMTAQQGGKNAFLSVNHITQYGTAGTNQDRAIWTSMWNIFDTISQYSISGNVVTVNLNNPGAAPTQMLVGMLVILSGFSTSTFLNGINLTITDITNSGLTISMTGITHGDVSLTDEVGQLDQVLWSMAGHQIELDVNGTPSVQGSPDSEISTLSLQLQDSHVGNIVSGSHGTNCLRSQYYRSQGAGIFVDGGYAGNNNIKLLIQNDSTTNGAGQDLVNLYISGVDDVACAGLGYVGTFIASPRGARFQLENIGLFIDDFGTNIQDYAIYVAGGNSSINGNVALSSLFALTGSMVGTGSLSLNSFTASALTPIASGLSIGNVGTPGSTTYGYTLVSRDAAGGVVSMSSQRTTTTGNATLDSTNYNILELSGCPSGPAFIDVYRTQGGATQGKIGTFAITANNYTLYQNLTFNDTGLVADGSSIPSGNSTGAIKAAGPVSAGQYTVATLPTGQEGTVAYATDGRKVGETPGAGTGVPTYFSNGNWRVYSTDAPVAA